METKEPLIQPLSVNGEGSQHSVGRVSRLVRVASPQGEGSADPEGQTECDLDDENQEAYDDLIVSIEAKEQGLNLLIAVCDDARFRDRIVTQYEEELQPDFRPYRVTLARGEPSLSAAINQLVQQEEYRPQHNPAVITVTGAEKLYFLKLGNERSEQEIFFGYLQWTREALRNFPYAIVLWVTNQILVNLIQKAPDFWSWRNGVFRFVLKKTITISTTELEPFRLAFSNTELARTDDDNPYFLPIEDLQQLIQQIEQQGEKNSSLATLYSSLGQIYQRRLDRGEALDYKKEQDLAIKYFTKAVELQKELGLETDLSTSLNNLALLYYSQGRYSDAEPLYQQALELRKRLLGEEHPDVATSLNNLAELYLAQGRYSEAEALYLQALELSKRQLGEEHPNLAIQLNNLALLYYCQERYSEAELLSLQAIEIDRRLLGEENPGLATDLHNLALIYRAQGRYDEAEALFLQALQLKKRLLPQDHPLQADTIYALGNMYRQQGRYSEAEPLCVKALELDKSLLGNNHPNVAESLNNLAELYHAQGRYSEAEPLYLQALAICDRVFGANHPKTIAIRKNLEELQAKMSEQ